MTDLGNILQEARSMRGITLEEAEQATHISRRYLQALEEEQFNVFPAPVFARGFLRNYSQYLGLDPVEMLAMWPETAAPALEQPPPPENVRDSWRARSPVQRFNRPRTATRGGSNAPSPLYRASVPRSEPAPARNIAALVIGVVALLIIVAIGARASAGGGSGSAGSRPAAVPSAGTSTGLSPGTGQAKPVQPPPVRKAGTMPALVGQDEQTAVTTLQKAGVIPLIIRIQNDSRGAKPGAVAQQDPKPDTSITTSTSVTLIINQAAAANTAPTPIFVNPAAASSPFPFRGAAGGLSPTPVRTPATR